MTESNGILVRLGNVFYWLGTGVAVLFGIVAIAAVGFNLWGLWQHGIPEVPKIPAVLTVVPPLSYDGFIIAGIFVVLAIVVWLMGRVARYVLTGR